MAENTNVLYENLKLEDEIVITYNNIKTEPFENYIAHQNIMLEDGNSLINNNCIKEEYLDNTDYLEDELSPIHFHCEQSGKITYISNDVKDEPQNIGFEDMNDDKCSIDYVFNKEGFQSNRPNYKKETLYCDVCMENYEDFCPNCQTLIRLLDNCVNNEWNRNEIGIENTIPKNILEIRKGQHGEGIFALKSIPKGVIFGPCMGLEIVEKNATEYAWKVTNRQCIEKEDTKIKTWLCYINCTEDNLKNNLYAFQYEANLYYRSSRQICSDEELLVYYDNELFENLNNEMNEFYCPIEETVETVFACIPCCLGFDSELCLRKHKISCVFASAKESQKELVRCSSCDICLDEEFLKDHMDYNCEKCIRTNKSLDVNQNHRNHRNVKQSFKCESCEAAFTCKTNLYRHMIVHVKVKNFHCNECDYKACRKDYLQLHIRNKHSMAIEDEKKHKCSICDYETYRRNYLKRHMDAHKGIKPFKCDICERRFTEKGSLKRHILVHSGEKPYNCDICEYRCTQKGTLDKHRKRHTGDRPHACHICSRKFLEKCKLVRHMKVHVEKSYICSVCTFASNIKSDFRDHICVVHRSKSSL